ncbi:Cullin-4A [Desmophyllum pertusum]|uniref:Cullin-4A n=1 Tax=Desmophyllum pertusum TaxID=174260 RepID=A0A9W9ZX46_9CNID|nr:Cullin-4A [Desmophyllum pertusum]
MDKFVVNSPAVSSTEKKISRRYLPRGCYGLLFCSSSKPHLPENFKEATWEKLKEAVQAIHHKTFVIYSSEELYKAVENMCSHKMAATLYDLLKAECESHVKSNLQQFV